MLAGIFFVGLCLMPRSAHATIPPYNWQSTQSPTSSSTVKANDYNDIRNAIIYYKGAAQCNAPLVVVPAAVNVGDPISANGINQLRAAVNGIYSAAALAAPTWGGTGGGNSTIGPGTKISAADFSDFRNKLFSLNTTCGGGPICPGNGCEVGESCLNCPADCGACTYTCGQFGCEAGLGENCANCPADCGACPSCNNDGIKQAWEQCDDGNLNNNDNCTNSCTNARCGDGIIWNQGAGTEQCDDGNLSNGDGCSSTCQLEACNHNGIKDGSEQCDDGNMIDNDDCTNACQTARCGDNIVWNQGAGTEQCDDGQNGIPGDGCRDDCTTCTFTDTQNGACGQAPCLAGKRKWDHVATPALCDGAPAFFCQPCVGFCGDGIVNGTEQCDNDLGAPPLSNDGCSSTCTCEYPPLWTNAGCGAGSCAGVMTSMYKTKTSADSADCAQQSQCFPGDPGCAAPPATSLSGLNESTVYKTTNFSFNISGPAGNVVGIGSSKTFQTGASCSISGLQPTYTLSGGGNATVSGQILGGINVGDICTYSVSIGSVTIGVIGSPSSLSISGTTGGPACGGTGGSCDDRWPQPCCNGSDDCMDANLSGLCNLGACFVAGTTILTPDGAKPIESIKEGSQIVSVDPDTSRRMPNLVVHAHRRVAPEVLNAIFSNGVSLKVTAEHPFYDPERHEYHPIGEFKAGDEVVFLKNATDAKAEKVRLVSKDVWGKDMAVYNLTVEKPFENYIAEGIIVHNKVLCFCVSPGCGMAGDACGSARGCCGALNCVGGNGGTCQSPSCGDNIVDAGEQCDLGNSGNGACPKLCSSTCQTQSCSPPVCGNGIQEAGEGCDLGAAGNGSCPKTCSAACQFQSCCSGTCVPDAGTCTGKECGSVSGHDSVCTSTPCTASCGTCGGSFTCGGRGVPNHCGMAPTCPVCGSYNFNLGAGCSAFAGTPAEACDCDGCVGRGGSLVALQSIPDMSSPDFECCGAGGAPCAATTSNNCSLPATPDGSTAGSCVSGYGGACNFNCSGGSWSQNSNTCAPVCGNSLVQSGEQCDPPNGTTCDTSCQTCVFTANTLFCNQNGCSSNTKLVTYSTNQTGCSQASQCVSCSAVCGNNACEAGETPANCCQDCGCGSGTCEDCYNGSCTDRCTIIWAQSNNCHDADGNAFSCNALNSYGPLPNCMSAPSCCGYTGASNTCDQI